MTEKEEQVSEEVRTVKAYYSIFTEAGNLTNVERKFNFNDEVLLQAAKEDLANLEGVIAENLMNTELHVKDKAVLKLGKDSSIKLKILKLEEV